MNQIHSPLYHPDSPWVQPACNWPVHVDSGKNIAAWVKISTGLTNRWQQYSYRLHDVDEDTRISRVQITGVWSTVDPSGRAMRSNNNSFSPLLPIPADMTPSPGTDASVIILDHYHEVEIGLWGAEYDYGNNRWKARNGYMLPFGSIPPKNNVPNSTSQFLSRGPGFGYYAGGLRYETVMSGFIGHALAIASPASGSSWEYPASKSDGVYDDEYAIPEGARFLLSSKFPLAGLPEPIKVIGRCLQMYGMIFSDRVGVPSGSSKIHDKIILFENARWEDILETPDRPAETALGVFPIDAFYRVNQLY